MEKLNLGIAREIITPALGSHLYGYNTAPKAESVGDDITATAFYFTQGDKKSLMISFTLGSISVELTDEIFAMVKEKFVLDRENCLFSATHTHTGPYTGASGLSGMGPDRKYCDEILFPKIVSVIEKAMKSPQPVTVGIACGDSYVGINRREILPDNEVDLGQNPWGPFNPRMTVISFKTDDGSILANMVHYGCHCTASGCSTVISRDWAGYMIDILEKESGGITAFFPGPEGDVGPRLTNGTTGWSVEYAQALGAIAGQDAVRIFNSIFDWHNIELKTSTKKISIPLKKRIPFDEAKEIYKNEYQGKDAECVSLLKKTVIEQTITSYDKGEDDKECEIISQNIVALGNVIFAAFPYELFSEIGLRIDKYIKDALVLSLVITNKDTSYTYFVTEDTICRGGYEVELFSRGRVQPYVDNADWHLITQTVAHIKNLKEN